MTKTAVAVFVCVCVSLCGYVYGLNEVHICDGLSEGEEQYVFKRRSIVQRWSKRHNIKWKWNAVPKIALLGSGGGERAMLGLLGSLVQLQKYDLLDSIMYLGGISGSTWCMTSLYDYSKWSTDLDNVQQQMIERLDGPPVSPVDVWKKLNKYYNQQDTFSLTDVWAAMFITDIVKQIDENTLTSQSGNQFINPYPIYTVIDMQSNNERLYRDTWFEITPHEAGYSLLSAFVNSTFFGSHFEKGKLKKIQPEIDMLYLQGLCSSDLTDGGVIMLLMLEQITKLIPLVQYSPGGQSVLLTLVDLNIVVLSNGNATSLVNNINLLLEGKKDKQGRTMIITERQLQHDPTHNTLKRYTLYVCENFNNWFPSSNTSTSNPGIIITIIELLWNWTWGTTNNFLNKMNVNGVSHSLLNEEERYYEDAGLFINSPYFPMFRKERNIDLMISLDFSAGDPFETVKSTAKLCKQLKIPFPKINIPENTTELEDFYVFKGGEGVPTVIHIPLFNKVNCGNNITAWANRFVTFQGPYSQDMIVDLTAKAGENVINNHGKILTQIKHIIKEENE